MHRGGRFFSLRERFQQYDLRYTHLYTITLIDSAGRRAYLMRARSDAARKGTETPNRPRAATPDEETPLMEALGNAMVVTSDAESRFTLMRIVSSCGLDPLAAETLNETRSMLARHPVAVVVCDEQLSDGSFRDVVREAARLPRKVPVIVSSRSVDWKHYLSILSAGAFDLPAAAQGSGIPVRQRAECSRVELPRERCSAGRIRGRAARRKLSGTPVPGRPCETTEGESVMADLHGFLGITGMESRRRPIRAATHCPNCGADTRDAAAVRGVLRRRHRCPFCDAVRPPHVVRHL